MKDKILEWFSEDEFMFADGFDDAILGIDDTSMRVVYSVSRMIEMLMKDMSEEDACEYLEYNVISAYVGEKTPIYCRDNM